MLLDDLVHKNLLPDARWVGQVANFIKLLMENPSWGLLIKNIMSLILRTYIKGKQVKLGKTRFVIISIVISNVFRSMSLNTFQLLTVLKMRFPDDWAIKKLGSYKRNIKFLFGFSVFKQSKNVLLSKPSAWYNLEIICM